MQTQHMSMDIRHKSQNPSTKTPAASVGDFIGSVSRPKNFFRFISYLTLLLTTTSQNHQVQQVIANEQKGEPQLEIHTLFRPDPCDRKAKSTDVLTLHYKGSIHGSDEVFDSSYDRDEPLTFQLGIGHVIRGWEKGLVGACVGERRKLVVPPHLAYGDAKHDQIPPGSTLVFEIEILKVADGPEITLNVFKEIDADEDGRLNRKEMADFLRRQLSQMNQHGDSGSEKDPDQVQMVDEIFMQEDRDKDGYITHDEFSGPKYDRDEL